MSLSKPLARRGFLLGASAFGVSACMGGGVVSRGGAGAGGAPAESFPPAPNPDFDRWLDSYAAGAASRSFSGATIAALRGARFLPGVVEKDRNQTEFTRTTEDYLAIAASPERVTKGRAALARHAALFAALEARYGVPGPVVCAVWGLESKYGERMGDVPVLSSLATLAFDGRRGDFFAGQLNAALKILEHGDVSPGNFRGSWAGAMGHTQFIPTSYLASAVDFGGDGRRDIWSADPTDALASTAAYLKGAGWTRGGLWGLEVRVPAGVGEASRSTADWAGLGVVAAGGGALPSGGAAKLVLPAGPGAPGFLLFHNFNVILRYNNALNYGLGVGHLSDRIAGGAAIQGQFPPDAQGLSQADRQQIQIRLTAAGYDTGGTDGVIGAKTMAAISAWQADHGQPVTGTATRALLDAL